MHLPMRLYRVAVDARLHDLRPAGVVADEVHDPAKPRGASDCVHAAVLLCVWDGRAFADVYEKVG